MCRNDEILDLNTILKLFLCIKVLITFKKCYDICYNRMQMVYTLSMLVMKIY